MPEGNKWAPIHPPPVANTIQEHLQSISSHHTTNNIRANALHVGTKMHTFVLSPAHIRHPLLPLSFLYFTSISLQTTVRM